MSLKALKSRLARFLEEVDIQIDGRRPWDISVHDERFYTRVFLHGSLGLGESYMDGWWDCQALDDFFTRILRGQSPYPC
jgi:cyclopropane-fatty-acyl-phospholipid synthase